MEHDAHSYAMQLQAFLLAASFPALALAMLAGAWYEGRRRKMGSAFRPGSRRTIVAARFVTAPD